MSQAGKYFTGATPPPAGFVETLTGDIGGPVPPTAGNINVITGLALNNSGSTIDFTGSPGTSTLVLNVTDTNDNTLVGLGAGNILLTTGFQNTAFGAEALTQITTENNNTAVGFQALHAATSNLNTAVGSGSLNMVSTGAENTAIGSASGVLLSTGNRNTFLGTDAGGAYSTGSNNISIGYNVGGTGAESFTTRIGIQGTQTQAFIAGITGVTVASPTSVVIDTVTGQLGVAAGGGSPIEIIKGNDGVAETPTAGVFNFLTANSTVKFLGSASTETLDFGITNLVLGNTLPSLAGGTGNIGMGILTMNAITSGTNNVAIGGTAMQFTSTGGNNLAFGVAALQSLTTGSHNTAIGSSALGSIAAGSYNIAIGDNAGNAYAGDSSNISIGYTQGGVLGQSNVLRIGAGTGVLPGYLSKAFIYGIDGVNVGSVAKVVTMASDQLGTATITAGTGISITPGANTITIAATGGSFTWSVITANQTAAVNNGYFCNKAGTLALALPATSAVGDIIEVVNINTATGIQFTQAAGQQIFVSTASTTLGATGTLTSSAIGDTIKLVCRTANTTWWATSMIGNWTPA